MSDLRALSGWQPWWTLIALGVKWIETRSWSTSYRGPLLLHAARKMPASWLRVGDYEVRGYGRFGLALEGPGLPALRTTPRLEGCILPRGAVVATCDLVDVVPIVDVSKSGWGVVHRRASLHERGRAVMRWTTPLYLTEQLALVSSDGGRGSVDRYVTDQLPYGDFSCDAPSDDGHGRFAWLLENVKPVDPPIPMRGRQGLWRVAADALGL